MLENKKSGLDNYYKKFLAGTDTDENVGCIVMNCNPFTKGHLALITYAAKSCSLLHIFVVEENRSCFPFADRLLLVPVSYTHLYTIGFRLSFKISANTSRCGTPL